MLALLVIVRLCRSLCFGARVALGRKDFAGVTLLAFYGRGRSAAFLRLRRSKTSTHGQSKVQRLKIEDSWAIRSCEVASGDVPAGRSLFGLSPSGYRHRRNKLLSILAVDQLLSLTPGGLLWWRSCPLLPQRSSCERHPMEDASEEPGHRGVLLAGSWSNYCFAWSFRGCAEEGQGHCQLLPFSY